MTHNIASLERTITKSVRYVAEGGERFTFGEAAREICQHYRNALVTDAVHYEKKTAAEVLRVLKVCVCVGVGGRGGGQEGRRGAGGAERGSGGCGVRACRRRCPSN